MQYEYVQALYSFQPLSSPSTSTDTSAMEACLDLKVGQWIRIVNKDPSGWYDGEVSSDDEGRGIKRYKRGWFPSNYVGEPIYRSVEDVEQPNQWLGNRKGDVVSTELHSPTSSPSLSDIRQASGTSESSASSSRLQRQCSDSSLASFTSVSTSPSLSSVSPILLTSLLPPLHKALSVMRSQAFSSLSVQTQSTSGIIYQSRVNPLISGVRNILQQSGCLTRDGIRQVTASLSSKHSEDLFASRTQVLEGISMLFDAAKKVGKAKATRDKETPTMIREMVSIASELVTRTESFLMEAQRRGIGTCTEKKLVDSPLSIRSEQIRGSPTIETNHKRPPRYSSLRSRHVFDRGSLVAHSEDEGEPPPVTITPLNVKKRRRSRERRGSFESHMTGSSEYSHSIASTTTRSDTYTSASGWSLRVEVRDKSPKLLVKAAEGVHDRLLSTTASYVFNVHAIGRDSHISSWVLLIDLTREVIERVRELLVIVEEFERRCTPPRINEGTSREVAVLARTKDSLYTATSSLVTAARTLFTSNHHLYRGPTLTIPTSARSESDSDDDEEKADLLQCATVVLRCSGEGVAALKLLQKAMKTIAISSNKDEDTWEPKTDTRNKHTLSMLGRKATSLSCLRERYENQGFSEVHHMTRIPVSRPQTLFEEEEDSDGAEENHTVSTTTAGSSNENFDISVKVRPPSDTYGDEDDRDTPVPRYYTHNRHSISEVSEDVHFSLSNVDPQNKLLMAPTTSHITTAGESEQLRRNSMGILAGPSTESSDASSIRSQLLETPATSTASLLDRDYAPKEISFNASGQVVGGTLRSLVERLSLHSQTIDATFSSTFFLCFRLFTTPLELAHALFERFNVTCPTEVQADPESYRLWMDSKATPVRLRIYNFLKTWLEIHFQPEKDDAALEPIREFSRTYMMPVMPAAAQRLIDLSHRRTISASTPMTKLLTRAISTDQLKGRVLSTDGSLFAPPTPVVSKGVISNLRAGTATNLCVVDIDPLELARQFTIMESRLFCAMSSQELLGQEFSKKNGNAPHVKAMSALSTRITGWIAEIILDEQDAKRRTNLLKYFIKLGDRCLQLNNYNTLMAVVAALNSSTIARLKRTWEGLSHKSKNTLDALRKATEHTRNYAHYRGRLRETLPPCLPFLGLYLTDLTFCHEGNPNFRPSPIEPNLKLINFDKYQKIAKIISDIQRFQVSYDLLEVGELQQWISGQLNGLASGGDVGELYRRSLLLEPRLDGGVPSSPNPGKSSDILSFNWR